MPPKKKKLSRDAQPARQTRRRVVQGSARSGNDVPNVYAEMLAEVAAKGEHDSPVDQRPLKRRKITPEAHEDSDRNDDVGTGAPRLPQAVNSIARPQQIVYDDFEESEDSDIEFEDIELEPAHNDTAVVSEGEDQPSLKIDLSRPLAAAQQRPVQRRKPITKAERDFRLDVHKWHLLSLLIHGLQRSRWCDDEVVHTILKPLVSRKTIKLLHMDETQPSFQRNHSFNKGIEEVCFLWRTAWDTTAEGLRRAHWRDKVDAQREFDRAEDPVELDDFRSAAQTRKGSRDLGAQLFTALLRSLALDARLVFSLQVFPFAGVGKGQIPEKSRAAYIRAPSQSYEPARSTNANRRKITDSPYPVFWTEVLNPATDTWIPLDPLVRNSINKPKTQFEPPASDYLNQMMYVLSYEDDLTVRDVTQRYTQWFNAKTRKLRVESTRDGVAWWNKALRCFRRKIRYSRDEIEDQFLAQRSAAEGMPKNVQDFKGHPVYVLERHIRSNQVIHPKRESGRFSTGSGKSAKVESVFRTQDLHLCRSADAWYRRGRDVKIGQQPLKRAKPKLRDHQNDNFDDDEEDAEAQEGVALYAEFQTRIYEPPPVVNNRIPRNAYGNLDVYVATMIPAGAVHVNHPLAGEAARILGIDYADAVTGFVFRGRQGTAVIGGVVVALGYTAAVTVVIEGLEWLGTQEVQNARSKVILSIWKRMLTALRVHQKIEAEYGGTDDGDANMSDSEKFDDDDSGDEDSTYVDARVDDGGGFMLEADESDEKAEKQAVDLQAMKSSLPVILPDDVVHQPVHITMSPHEPPMRSIAKTDQAPTNVKDLNADDDDDLFEDDHDLEASGGGFVVQGKNPASGAPSSYAEEGGGFMVADVESDSVADNFEGGGFVPEDENQSYSEAAESSTKDDLLRQSAPVSGHSKTIIATNDVEDKPHATVLPSNKSKDGEGDGISTGISQSQQKSNDAEQGAKNEDDNATKQTTNKVIPVLDGTTTSSVDDDNENSSLLSHDPDEDDDEPDWLDDALIDD